MLVFGICLEYELTNILVFVDVLKLVLVSSMEAVGLHCENVPDEHDCSHCEHFPWGSGNVLM